MNISSENDEANAIEYVWDKYIYLIFAILMGIGVVIWVIPDLIKHGIRSGLPYTLQLPGCFLAISGIWLDEIGRKKLGDALKITGWIVYTGGFIARYIFEGKFF
ncbi:MAG: hypothetical protein ACYC27_07975 [Armatimonadota bacterium]